MRLNLPVQVSVLLDIEQLICLSILAHQITECGVAGNFEEAMDIVFSSAIDGFLSDRYVDLKAVLNRCQKELSQNHIDSLELNQVRAYLDKLHSITG